MAERPFDDLSADEIKQKKQIILYCYDVQTDFIITVVSSVLTFRVYCCYDFYTAKVFNKMVNLHSHATLTYLSKDVKIPNMYWSTSSKSRVTSKLKEKNVTIGLGAHS